MWLPRPMETGLIPLAVQEKVAINSVFFAENSRNVIRSMSKNSAIRPRFFSIFAFDLILGQVDEGCRKIGKQTFEP